MLATTPPLQGRLRRIGHGYIGYNKEHGNDIDGHINDVQLTEPLHQGEAFAITIATGSDTGNAASYDNTYVCNVNVQFQSSGDIKLDADGICVGMTRGSKSYVHSGIAYGIAPDDCSVGSLSLIALTGSAIAMDDVDDYTTMHKVTYSYYSDNSNYGYTEFSIYVQ